MSLIPVVDYDRATRIAVPRDPLPLSQYTLGTRLCVLIIIIVGVILYMRWHGKKRETFSDVRFQKV